MPTLVGVVLRIARVVVDVTGVDKPFDYLIPAELASQAVVGARVRVPLHRREVPGWIMAVLDADRSDVDVERLLPMRAVTSIGPAPEIVNLAEWAASRWASRRRPFFVTASPTKRVHRLGSTQRRNITEDGRDSALKPLLGGPGGLVLLGPATDPMVVVRAAMALGPTLVVAPTLSRARRVAAECRRLGRTTASYPNDWAVAASGVDVVVGARSAVWATVPALAVIVVFDEHDDALQEERAPTWHARDVAIERARRGGIPCVLASAVPTLTARSWAGTRVVEAADARAWPSIRVIDRNADERWASSLVTSPLIQLLRDHRRRVVCVLNVKGRARALVCDSCRSVARCEHCDAGLSQPAKDHFSCPRCGITRPVVCLGCGSQKFRSIRVGISRLRDEMEAAAGRVVQEVTPATEALDPAASVFVGTEAVLHRLERADSVVFLDIDAELLAPRYRASEQALDLIAHGARLVAPSADAGGGEVVLQTALPNHDLIVGLVAGDVSAHIAAETARRQRLRLPPYGALAEISGAGTTEAVAALSTSLLVEVAAREDSALVRAGSWDDLSSALASLPKTKQRIRISVDPARV